MADTLVTIRSAVKVLISSTTILSDAEVDQAVQTAASTLSRLFPREVVAQTVFNEDITAEAWTAISDTAVTLANKPIRFGSETVTQSSVDFTRNTDYEIDYVNGTITMLSTGGLSAASATITYKLDGTMIDISSLLTEPISIEAVDVIRSDQVPSEYEGWYTHGDFLMITSSVNQSQMRFVDNDHIRIYYLALHVEPGASTSGSYPDFLDELVLIGVTGYGLLTEALEQEHLAIVDIASARTSVGNIAAIHTAIGTAVTSLAAAQSDANVALDAAVVELVLANAEYDKVSTVQGAANTELATANTELDLATAEIVLGNAEVDKATSELAKIDTTAGGIPEAETELGLIITALGTSGDFDTALDLVAVEVESDAISADKYLAIGDGFINAVNVGRDTSSENREYALAKVTMAEVYIGEANARLRAAEAKLTLVTNWLRVSQAHHQSAVGFNENARMYIEGGLAHQAGGEKYTTNARVYIEEARTYILNGDGYVNEATGFIQEASQRLTAALRYVEEIGIRLSQIRHYLEEADRYHTSADSQRQSADLYRQEGNARVRDFITALEDRAQISSHPRVSSTRQYSSDGQRQILRWDHL